MIRKSLQNKIDYSVDLLRRSEEMALRLDPENGFYLAFSGGKDSQVLYHIAKMAGVRFKAHMSLTSVDPAEVIRFVKHNYPDVELIKPKMSIYDMAIKKHFLPTMRFRWCCAEYKEIHGAGKVTLVGVRRQESARRAKRKEFSVRGGGGKDYEGDFDQFSEHTESMVTCVGGKDKILLSPFLDWTEADVWEFLNESGIAHCKLYDEGYKRIGCILCPMSSYKVKKQDINRYPHAKKKWIEVIRELKEKGYVGRKFDDPELDFRWWLSGESFDKFYAKEVLQQKIDFDNELNI